MEKIFVGRGSSKDWRGEVDLATRHNTTVTEHLKENPDSEEAFVNTDLFYWIEHGETFEEWEADFAAERTVRQLIEHLGGDYNIDFEATKEVYKEMFITGQYEQHSFEVNCN